MQRRDKEIGKVRCTACVIFLLSIALTLHWLVFQAKETVPGVTSRPLGPCYLDWFSERPALVLACPRTDMIRLWPLPVEHIDESQHQHRSGSGPPVQGAEWGPHPEGAPLSIVSLVYGY